LITLMRVVLPDPFGPIRMTTLRSSTSSETPSNARRLPNAFATSLMERMIGAIDDYEKKKGRGLKLIALLWNAGPSYGIRGCVPRARLDPCGGTRLDDNLPDLVRCRRSVTAGLKRKGPGYTVQGAIVGLYVILE